MDITGPSTTYSRIFFNNFFGEKIPTHYKSWVSVSIRQGGTTIPKPEEMVDLNYLASTYECSHLLDSLKGKEDFDPVRQTATMKEVRGGYEEEEIG